MSTTTASTPASPDTLGEVSEHYASTLLTALLRAGAPGRVVRAHYRSGSEAAQEACYTRWSFVGLARAGTRRAGVLRAHQLRGGAVHRHGGRYLPVPAHLRGSGE